MLKSVLAAAFVATLAVAPGAMAETVAVTASLKADAQGPTISRNIYGQFVEHLGRGVYEGIWVGPDSPIPNTRGIRNDVVAALKAAGLRVVLDTENQTVNYKVRQHSLAKTPNLMVLGRREAENRTITLRKLGVEGQESLALEAAISMLAAEAVPPDLR